MIVAGNNYGQGSSREHAALSPRYLGIRVVVAASFARIHRSNLIAQGIVPLVAEEAAHAAAVGDPWRLPGLRAAVGGGAEQLSGQVAGADALTVALELSRAERELLLAHTRSGARHRVPAGRTALPVPP